MRNWLNIIITTKNTLNKFPVIIKLINYVKSTFSITFFSLVYKRDNLSKLHLLERMTNSMPTLTGWSRDFTPKRGKQTRECTAKRHYFSTDNLYRIVTPWRYLGTEMSKAWLIITHVHRQYNFTTAAKSCHEASSKVLLHYMYSSCFGSTVLSSNSSSTAKQCQSS